MQSLHTVTPPQDQHACLINGSPIDWEDTDLFCLSFDPVQPKPERVEGTSRKKRKEINDREVREHYDDGDITKTRRGESIKQFTALYRRRQVSRAQQQFALLQRCFFPRRDVVKWFGKWRLIGLSCEVHHTVQEPLTRLPFEANSTCVELPYTTMWWSRLALEDLNLAGSLSLSEHYRERKHKDKVLVNSSVMID
jgi:hypothetical protein